MNRHLKLSTTSVLASPFRSGFALLILSAWLAVSANGKSQIEAPAASPSIHVKHVLGFEDVRRHATGELSIQDGNLRFQRSGKPAAQVSITAIHNISLGTEDKQVGGMPMMLGKAAVPFGGGRIVSLFSHKRYDSLTIEYIDDSGGFHGAIFELAKGQGKAFKKALLARGLHAGLSVDPASTKVLPEEPARAALQWSVQVDRIDPGATTLAPSFSDAIYENILQELPKSKRFEHVFRSGDSTANGVSAVLVLKTLVERYTPGSETRRAVTTVAGTTKLRVRIQLLTRNSRVLLDRTVEGDVRFIGDNLRATNKVANKTAKLLKQLTFPPPAAGSCCCNSRGSSYRGESR